MAGISPLRFGETLRLVDATGWPVSDAEQIRKIVYHIAERENTEPYGLNGEPYAATPYGKLPLWFACLDDGVLTWFMVTRGAVEEYVKALLPSIKAVVETADNDDKSEKIRSLADLRLVRTMSRVKSRFAAGSVDYDISGLIPPPPPANNRGRSNVIYLNA